MAWPTPISMSISIAGVWSGYRTAAWRRFRASCGYFPPGPIRPTPAWCCLLNSRRSLRQGRTFPLRCRGVKSMAYDPNSLYNLLPAVYRERDEAMNFPLRGLLGLIGNQAALLDADITQLYNNLFIDRKSTR